MCYIYASIYVIRNCCFQCCGMLRERRQASGSLLAPPQTNRSIGPSWTTAHGSSGFSCSMALADPHIGGAVEARRCCYGGVDGAPAAGSGIQMAMSGKTGKTALYTTRLKKWRKTYYRHNTRPGSLQAITMDVLMEKHGGAEVLRKAVSGMLPKNRLREPCVGTRIG
ncbi:hypothetical protein B0T26DRAFT_876246 [Lasiosphaeria miniovina]|uniref:Ribosomal protein L13 n=1 Tax=Lasiosphaeria miniovina TaxID=1954250 RepID=A0AA39ZT47_9PEZI|nr:uncharacterized protein B0T26DRAFT_876246 [Lasiosphaeria miniovina]KAK0703123.1 hypothetical protein B0T26DRAFT_876246 [Lasiosphaeria miniovina]